jgi:hypothetical protein
MAVINDSGLVVNIIVCDDDEPDAPNLITYTDENPARIDDTYQDGHFIAPQPYPSWTLDNNYDWVAPIPRPSEGQWDWNEVDGEWKEVNRPPIPRPSEGEWAWDGVDKEWKNVQLM